MKITIASFMRRGARVAAALAGLAALAMPGLPADAAPFDGRRAQFADEGFNHVWTRTDAQSVRGGRTWYWGPQPWFDYAEFYRQGTNGLRTVQYFDKARMEINNPGDRSVQDGVTNGLLVVELVSGHLKKGNDPYDYDSRQPADVPVAGNPKADNPNSPTYASFGSLATFDNNGYRDPNRLNQRISAALDGGGNLSSRQDLADGHAETTIVQYNTITGHNIPRVFWDFMNMQGPVIADGGTRTRPVVDWLFAMGLPITDAYWTRARIGTADKDVLVQLFERRVLTYVPDNPAGYQVEMGNVGQHYFQWRYPHLGQPWAAPDPQPALLFASNQRDGKHMETFLYTGTGPVQITGNPLHPATQPSESVPFSQRRSFDPLQNCLILDSRRGDGEHRQIYQQPLIPLGYSDTFRDTCQPGRLTYSDGTAPQTTTPYIPGKAHDYNASISPDGTKIVLVSDRDGAPQLYIMTANGMSLPQRLNNDGCTTQVPTWSPDGRTLFWEQQCSGGKFAVMRGELAYSEDNQGWVMASLTDVRALTDQGSDNRYPRVSPDGKTIVFTSYRDGNAEIYTIDVNGGSLKRLTNSAGDDEAATWNANGSQLAFASNRDGDYDIYVMNADGSGQAALTDNTADDRWPAWAQ
jgi:WD40 repeat protein